MARGDFTLDQPRPKSAEHNRRKLDERVIKLPTGGAHPVKRDPHYKRHANGGCWALGGNVGDTLRVLTIPPFAVPARSQAEFRPSPSDAERPGRPGVRGASLGSGYVDEADRDLR